MKKNTLLFFVLFAFIIYSCNESQLDSEESMELGKQGQDKNGSNGNNDDGDDLPFIGPVLFDSVEDDPKYCGEPVECEFTAGQNINAGLVTVSNDEKHLYVKVYSKAGFQDVEENIKMWIGLTPPDRRPPSGQFPYKVTETGDTHIFKIELESLPEWDREECAKQYVIIVHGDVLTEEGNSESGETAYGGCKLAEGKPWWAYMTYTTECCEESDYYGSARKSVISRTNCLVFNQDSENVFYGWNNNLDYSLFTKERGGTSMAIYLNGDECNENEENGFLLLGYVRVATFVENGELFAEVKFEIKGSLLSFYEFKEVNLFIGLDKFDLSNNVKYTQNLAGDSNFTFNKIKWPGINQPEGDKAWDTYIFAQVKVNAINALK